MVGAAQQDAEFHRVDESRTVDYRFLEAKRVIAAYLVSGADADRVAAEAAAAAVMEAIRAARSDDLTETRDRFAAIESSLGDYLSAWTRVAELRSRQIAIAKDKVIPLGEKLKNDAQFLSSKLAALERNDLQAIAIKATEQFNSGRIAVTDLIHTTSDESLKAADTGFAEFVKRLGIIRKAIAGTQEEGQVDKVLKSVDTYTKAYREYAVLSKDLDALSEGEMADLETSISAALEDLRMAVAERLAANEAEMRALGETTRSIQLTAAGIAIVAALLLSALIGRSIANPIIALSAVMRRMASGDLSAEIGGVDRRDEIGAIAGALTVLRTNLMQAEQERGERAALDRRAAEDRRIELARMADRFEATVSGIAQAVSASAGEINRAAEVMTGVSAQVSSEVKTVSTASGAALTSVGQVVSATEHLSSSITEIRRQMDDASDLARSVAGSAADTNQKVEALAEAAHRIGSVIDLINSIAAQTKLLALNATIEAARAGDAGRGFAIVASEVKALADQTERATVEISGQIGTIRSTADTSLASLNGIAETVRRLSEVSEHVAQAVRHQTDATAEIATGIRTTADGTSQVNNTIGTVDQAARSTSTAAMDVLSASRSLNRQSGELKAELEGFLRSIRAA